MTAKVATEYAERILMLGVPANELFAPLLNGKRILLRVSDLESRPELLRGVGLRGRVKDGFTGKRYEVFGAPCQLPDCFCDARVKEVEMPTFLEEEEEEDQEQVPVGGAR